MPVKYEHTQKGSRLLYWVGIFLVVDLLIVEALVYFLLGRGENALEPARLGLIMALVAVVPVVMLGWMGVMMSALTVTIDAGAVRLRFGGGMWRKTIPLQRVTGAEAVQNSFANGWGIRYLGRGCWLYNIAGLDAVEVHLDTGKRIRIGTREPEKLAEAIHKAISNKV